METAAKKTPAYFFKGLESNYSLPEKFNNYYPFGLTLAGTSYQRLGSQENKYLYNGKELQDDLDLNWYDYGARMYMPDLGRWGVVDPLAELEKNFPVSPYAYVRNNPIIYVDPTGMSDSTANSGQHPPTEYEPTGDTEQSLDNPLNGFVELWNWIRYGSATKPESENEEDKETNNKKKVVVRSDKKKNDVNIDDGLVEESDSKIPNPDNAPNNSGSSSNMPNEGKNSFVVTKYLGNMFLDFSGVYRSSGDSAIIQFPYETSPNVRPILRPGRKTYGQKRESPPTEKDSLIHTVVPLVN